ncbi:MAG: rRNA pseudouridine synthase [Oscillospiraceae bacterium]|nr:rRNA pseudouridine synthase [Oscillospiraceae bacterium]
MAERLQKIIAESGLMSRRAAELVISEGRVQINGRPAKLGDRGESSDRITLDGVELPRKEEKRYYMLNKPRGYVCSLHDEQGRKSVRELLPASAGRVYPVGRLDLMSEGLLLLTNDGEFANRVMHPSSRILKTYRTRVEGDGLEARIARLREPLELDGVFVRAVQVRILKKTDREAVLDITIGEGRNREIRRMCEEAGLHVARLTRIAEGELLLGDLPSGRYRPLSAEEIASVMGESTE